MHLKTTVIVTQDSQTKVCIPILSTVFFKGVCFSPPINPRQVGASQWQTWATFLQNYIKEDINQSVIRKGNAAPTIC